MRSLRWKITLFLVVTVLAVISMTSIVIDQTLDREFHGYLHRSHESRRVDISSSLSKIYEETGGWEAFLSHPSAYMLLHSAGIARLTDEDGETIFEGTVSRRRRLNPTNTEGEVIQLPNNLEAIPILWYGQHVGTAWVLGPPTRQHLPSREFRFRFTVRRGILLASLLAALLAVLLGLLGAQQLTQPIRELTSIANRLASGDLKARSQRSTQDELGGLSGTLNHLATELEQRDTARRKALADTAHEFRTPLATIQAHLEAMADGLISPNPESFNVILEEVNRLAHLTHDLQSFTLVEQFRQNPNLVRLDLVVLLREIEDRFRPLFQRRGINFSVVLPSNKVIVSSHSQALRQIIDNLLNNAIKYSPEHEGKAVTINLNSTHETTAIRVIDQGIGIPDQDLPHIFDRFYRVDASRSRQTGGVGLGLAIAKETAEAIGITLEVESVSGQGTTFTLTFPANSTD